MFLLKISFSKNPHFCKSALAGFTPDDFISMVEMNEILIMKNLGQLFCDGSARQIYLCSKVNAKSKC
ncbi:MAG: NAD(P)/FAD-dependent oxidoreductase [Ignavibacteria bacterium]|nr:NAD(P)/FAD-dependent oxidoreductase [Ignavibacteria bacterium]